MIVFLLLYFLVLTLSLEIVKPNFRIKIITVSCTLILGSLSPRFHVAVKILSIMFEVKYLSAEYYSFTMHIKSYVSISDFIDRSYFVLI